MVPLVAALIKFGLSTVAGAVAAKGKDLVQEKLGINLDDALGTEAGRIQLKQLEMEHEQFLITAAQATEFRELDFFKTEVADRDSARRREQEVAKAANLPWYVPNFISVLTLIVVLGGGWMFLTIEDVNARMVIVAQIATVLAYYYGTTRNSGIKDGNMASIIDRVLSGKK